MKTSEKKIRQAKVEIIGALRKHGDPLTLAGILGRNPEDLYWQALKELVHEDRITSAGKNTWEEV